MIVTHKMKMDLVDKPGRSILDVTQGDSIRVLELELLEQGAAWQIPLDLTVVIRYDKADGTGGCYDTLPDGTQAWQIDGNKLRIALAPALCSTRGYVTMQIALIHELEQISTFVIGLDVESEVAGGGEAEEYINLSNWLAVYGRVGPEGKSAYDIAVEHGFQGTEEVWLKFLKGEKGEQGETGLQGEKGDPGETPEIERPAGASFTLIKMGGEVVTSIYDGYTPEKGLDYFDGETPHIGENGNWWIAETDTGVKAGGTISFEDLTSEQKESLKGDPGETPEIKSWGNSFSIYMGGELVGTVYTPEKGLDYWTNDDKEQMVADVIAALPVYNGEVV